MNMEDKKKSLKLPSSQNGNAGVIVISNVGKIKSVRIAPGRLTIFSGINGSGKTSALYTIYGVLAQRIAHFRTSLSDKLAKTIISGGEASLALPEISSKDFDEILEKASDCFSKIIPDVLNCDASLLANARVDITIDRKLVVENYWSGKWSFTNETTRGNEIIFEVVKAEDSNVIIFKSNAKNNREAAASEFIANILFDLIMFPYQGRAFLLPSERAGINLFYQELNSRRTALINNLQKSKIDPLELMREMMVSRYAKPVADYIELLNQFPAVKKVPGKFANVADALDKLVLGSFDVSKDGAIYFRPNGARKNKLSLHLAASSAKSLYGLSFLLRYMLSENDVVMIDEPELNLHPDAQRGFARIVALMLSEGLNVMLSTHSDYIVREINILMMSKDAAPMSIRPSAVELYVFDGKGGAKRAAKDKQGLFIDDPFESSIRAMNDAYLSASFEQA
ncbi:MAG: AAA family ATPase [Rhodanobacter sp.]